jgi:predicted MPP superfamily phosphohydrolase
MRGAYEAVRQYISRLDDASSTNQGKRAPARFTYRRPRRGAWLQLFDIAGFEWNYVELHIDGLPTELVGTRLLQIGDLHLRPRWTKGLDELIAKVNADPPDVLMLSGDFIDNKHDLAPTLPRLAKLMTRLRAKTGMFATLGNHDGDLLFPQLMAMGVQVITHERRLVSVRGRDLELIGFPGPDRSDLSDAFLRVLPAKTHGVPRIVLSHYPDLIRAACAARLAPDLFFAGHTHGGQICLPNGFPPVRHDVLPRRLCTGVHDYDGVCLVVTRGLGFTHAPVRLFCPGEVVEVVLKNET